MPDRDRANLFVEFSKILDEFDQRLLDAGLAFYMFEGYRTFERQERLFAQGRTIDGPRVTNAKPGESWHNYGMAADYVADSMRSKPGIQWSWNLDLDQNKDQKRDWDQMVEIAELCGLEPAARWKNFKEWPHVQCRFGLSLEEAQELYKKGGLWEVWGAAINNLKQGVI